MKLLLFIAVMAVTALASPTQTNTPTPAPESVERKAILDTLRVPVEKDLAQGVVFKLDHIRVQDGWAFLRGVPQRPDGGAIDYSGTRYEEARELGAFDDGFSALLRKTDGKWKVVVYSIGATDVVWVPWRDEYHATESIFG